MNEESPAFRRESVNVTIDPALAELRRERAAHPEWRISDEHAWCASRGLRMRFPVPAPSYVAAAGSGETVVHDLHGIECSNCGHPADRMVLHPGGLIAVEHDAVNGNGSWSCAP